MACTYISLCATNYLLILFSLLPLPPTAYPLLLSITVSSNMSNLAHAVTDPPVRHFELICPYNSRVVVSTRVSGWLHLRWKDDDSDEWEEASIFIPVDSTAPSVEGIEGASVREVQIPNAPAIPPISPASTECIDTWPDQTQAGHLKTLAELGIETCDYAFKPPYPPLPGATSSDNDTEDEEDQVDVVPITINRRLLLLTHDAYLWHPPSTGIITGALLDRLANDGLISSKFNEEEAKAVEKWRKSHGARVPVQYVDVAPMTMEERRVCLQERRNVFSRRWSDLPPVPDQVGNLGDADPSREKATRRAENANNNLGQGISPAAPLRQPGAASANGRQTAPMQGLSTSASHPTSASKPDVLQSPARQRSTTPSVTSPSSLPTPRTPTPVACETPEPASPQPVKVDLTSPTPVSRGRNDRKRSLDEVDHESISDPSNTPPPKRVRLFKSGQVSQEDEPESDVFGERITNSISLKSTQEPAANGLSASTPSSPTPASRASRSRRAPARQAVANKKVKNEATRTSRSRAAAPAEGKAARGNARTARSKATAVNPSDPVPDQAVQKNTRGKGKRRTAAPESKGKKTAAPPLSKSSKTGAASKRGKAPVVATPQGVNETSAPLPTRRRITKTAAAAEAAAAENASALEAPTGNLRRSTRQRSAPVRGR